jgi:hypothetical protein
VEVQVLAICTSDHKPLWARLASTTGVRRRNNSFKFEACWNTDVECADIVHLTWGEMVSYSDTNMSIAIEKLNQCKRALTEWSSQKYGNVPRSLKSLIKWLDHLQRKEHPGNLDAIIQLQKEVDHHLEMEDIRWQ